MSPEQSGSDGITSGYLERRGVSIPTLAKGAETVVVEKGIIMIAIIALLIVMIIIVIVKLERNHQYMPPSKNNLIMRWD